MEVKNLQNQKGFTLVEIAIVLVIIGLLLGGVLKGQELIENAKIKSVTQDFDNLSAAYYAYQDRVGEIPGDTDVAGGTADGDIDATDSADAFWFDLRTQGFIDGAAVALAAGSVNNPGPTHDLAGTWSARPGAALTDANVADANGLFAVNHICASGIESFYAIGMDTKMDDGNALTGKVRSATDAANTVGAAYTQDTTLRTVCKEL